MYISISIYIYVGIVGNIVGNIPWPPWQWVSHGIVQFAFFVLSEEKVSGKIENNYKFIEEHLHIYSEAGPLG
jgi:hypothetical protein